MTDERDEIISTLRSENERLKQENDLLQNESFEAHAFLTGRTEHAAIMTGRVDNPLTALGIAAKKIALERDAANARVQELEIRQQQIEEEWETLLAEANARYNGLWTDFGHMEDAWREANACIQKIRDYVGKYRHVSEISAMVEEIELMAGEKDNG
jgi:uncharacterized coiled-coil DUF342 family protein